MSRLPEIKNIEQWMREVKNSDIHHTPAAAAAVVAAAPSTRRKSVSLPKMTNEQMFRDVKRIIAHAELKRVKQLHEVAKDVYSTHNINAIIRHLEPTQQIARHDILEFTRELGNLESLLETKEERIKALEKKIEKVEQEITFKQKFLIQRLPKKGVALQLLWNAIKTTRPTKSPHTRPLSSRGTTQKGGGRRRSRSHRGTRKNIPVRGFAVVQSSEKPWVKEANYRRWLGKLKRHTAKVRRHGEVEHPDNLCVDSNICKGDLGIPRRLMPQFTTPRDIQSFMNFAERRYGVKSRRATRRAARLKPSQEEINRERVEDVKEDIVEKKLDPNVPLIVSRDGYVIDGHHRWAAYKSHHPTKKLPVLLVGASARDVLSIAATWGAKHHQF